MSSSSLNGFEEFQKGEIPDSVYFSEEGQLKEVKFPASVWERARKIFSENSSPKTIFEFLKSDKNSDVYN